MQKIIQDTLDQINATKLGERVYSGGCMLIREEIKPGVFAWVLDQVIEDSLYEGKVININSLWDKETTGVLFDVDYLNEELMGFETNEGKVLEIFENETGIPQVRLDTGKTKPFNEVEWDVK